MEQGDDISIHYDPMIAKLCAHGMDRTQAIERLRRAIDEYHIHGLETTLEFGRYVLDHGFISAALTPALSALILTATVSPNTAMPAGRPCPGLP